jgi:hypothetical protein
VPHKKKRPYKRLVEAGVATRFQKGVSGLLLKKGVKKATEEFLKLSLDYVCPEEWKVNGLEIFRGQRITFSQILTFRMLYSATTGTRNPGLKDLQEILNRVLGREPTVIKHGEAPPDDEFEGMTGEELIQLALKISDSIQAKQKKLLPAPKETDAKEKEKPAAADPGTHAGIK